MIDIMYKEIKKQLCRFPKKSMWCPNFMHFALADFLIG